MHRIIAEIRPALARAALALALAAGLATGAAAATPGKIFAEPEQAAEALAAAARAADSKAALAVLGSDAAAIVSTGDKVADAAGFRGFAADYDKKHALERQGDDRAVLSIGENDFPFAIPLVRTAAGWRFDAKQGKEEILNRRIGRNELDAIQTLRAIVDAQFDYASVPRERDGLRHYAARFISSAGKSDGLYWPTKPGEAESPLGPLVGRATYEGYKAAGESKPSPYHGYLFRILSGQGKDAPGGAYDYRVRGKLVGGFAVVAWPANWGASGIMTFLVNQDGTIWQKDLGPGTAKIAGAMKLFTPDGTWSKP